MSRSMDFDEEAQKLFTKLGLDAKGGRPPNVPGGEIYAPMDPIWRDETTLGTIYVGNQTVHTPAARARPRTPSDAPCPPLRAS